MCLYSDCFVVTMIVIVMAVKFNVSVTATRVVTVLSVNDIYT